MKFTPFQIAMGLSLLLHGGVATAVYLLHPLKVTPAQLPLTPGQALEIVICSEPAPEMTRLPAPPLRPAEVPEPLPLPEIRPTDLAARPVVPPIKNEVLATAVPVVAPVVPTEIKAVALNAVQPAPASVFSEPPAEPGDDVPVNYLLNPKPDYPAAARRRKEEGLVILAVRVDREGMPGQIQIVQSSTFQALDEAAVRAVSQWRFTPAKHGNLKVPSQIQVPIRFELSIPKSNAPDIAADGEKSAIVPITQKL